ncbi:MAG: hypothetical protein GY801_27845 [bacterium]|nr:hypothetical protein [bacterium]
MILKYLSNGKMTAILNLETDLMLFRQAMGIFHSDRVAVPGTSIAQINLTKAAQYFARYDLDLSAESEEGKESLLIGTDILAENGEASVGGLLLFGLNPSHRLAQCGISFAHFTGTEIDAELTDKQNIVGTKRVDTRALPPDKVLRELLVNSCVHRDYSIGGSKIRIFMFSDRLEFITPGRLPNSITIEKLKAGVSYARNPVLVKFMENLRYIDRLGRGLPMVWREIQKIGGSVEFKELGEEFKVVLRW